MQSRCSMPHRVPVLLSILSPLSPAASGTVSKLKVLGFLLNLGTLGSKTACLKSARQWPTAWERRAAMGVRRRGDAGGASADSPSDHESGSEHEESGAEDELGGQEDPETERTVRGYGIGKENMLFRRLMVEDGEPAGPSSRAPILSTRPTRACIVTTASSASCLRKEIRRRSTAQTR